METSKKKFVKVSKSKIVVSKKQCNRKLSRRRESRLQKAALFKKLIDNKSNLFSNIMSDNSQVNLVNKNNLNSSLSKNVETK